jgi:lipopolysaccharide transport system ATP-binding protein
MSRPAIEAHELGKAYRIGLKAETHKTFREAVVRAFRSSLRRFGKPGSGRETHELFWALKDVSFAIAPGEAIGIIGRNGAGKSTLLKILSRITEPTQGTARLRGRVASLLEVGTGFHHELTGRENIYLNGAILGMKKAEIDRKFDEIVAFSEIEKFLDTPVKRYSSGMYVRLAFAVAAHLDPEILIVDEVLAVGDAAFQKKCLGKMQDVATNSGRTVFFVSHNMVAIRSLCPRALVLDKGRVIFDGDVEAGIEHYERNISAGGEAGIIRPPVDESLAMQIIEVELVDGEGQRTSKVDLFEPLRVRVHYRVRKPMTGSNVAVAVVYRGSTLILSFDTDTMPELIDRREAGDYESVIELPTDVLKGGVYTLNVDCGIINRPDKIHRLESCLQFEIRETVDTSFRSYASRRPGLIAARRPWQTGALVPNENGVPPG